MSRPQYTSCLLFWMIERVTVRGGRWTAVSRRALPVRSTQAFLEHHKEKWTQSPDCPCPRCVALGKLVHLSIYKWQVLNQDNPKGE